jgi:protein-tyrosine phosphatase
MSTVVQPQRHASHPQASQPRRLGARREYLLRRALITPIDALSDILKNRYGGKKAYLIHCRSKLRYWLGAYSSFTRIRWNYVNRVWFVCTGNVCRSPFAAALARQRGLNAHSCGLHLSEGSPADPAAKQTGRSYGVDLTHHRSRLFKVSEVGEGDLIVVMEPMQADLVLTAIPPSKGIQITLLGLWSNRPWPHLQDPYNHSDVYFDRCFGRIEEAVEHLCSKIPAAASATPTASTRSE